MLLPSIFKKIDSCLLAYELKQQNCLPIDNNQLLIEALIAPSVQMENNYERLETLGDSFLKILATVRFVLSSLSVFLVPLLFLIPWLVS